ncbi:MAG TPA: nucleoside recognition domain-containing protein [Thermoanaerobaculia bacterium]|nr:nucleoside recognition domain-containing protein [Thermoanaerobaculia bacterium]
MLNYIWFALMAAALVVAAFKGTAAEVTDGAISSARTAVEISIGLVGIMALWLGIMKIAEKAGLIAILARVIAPITRLIFPEVPRDHPAMGAMIMNISANMLGLSNAATPLGIKAMEELQTINPEKETASNAMVMFMAINTAAIQLIPATTIAVLAAAGSREPTVIIGSTLLATTIGSIAAVVATKVLQPFFPYSKLQEPDEVVTEKEGGRDA